MSTDFISIGKRVRFYRERKNLSQATLGELVDVHRTMIARIESGQKIPSLETLIAIANELDVSMDDLLIDSIETSPKQDNEVDYILLDCSPGEVKLLTKNMKNLRELIREFNIK